MKTGIFILPALLLCAAAVYPAPRPECASPGAVIVENGEAKAVVVLADNPSRTAEYAAHELVEHLFKTTGARLPVTAESDVPPGLPVRVYVGETEAAGSKGIRACELPLEAFVLRASDSEVYVLGREDAEADPLDEGNPFCGTLFGVYEILERYAGIRWLWPGELGTYAPARETIRIEETDEIIAPALLRRRYSWAPGRYRERPFPRETGPLQFSDEARVKYGRDLAVFIRRHRMGRGDSKGRGVGHTFGSWWRLYGQENPEWFTLDESGVRGAEDPGAHQIPMCVSSPALHRFIVEEFWDGGDILKIGESDSGRFCHCPRCMSWDGPQPEGARYRVISDRYARFYKTIQEMASKKNPDVQVRGYLYVRYFQAPLTGITLNENIVGEFVPFGGGNTVWYPMTEERLSWLKEQWLGWKKTGIRLAYRPNHTLAGYAMPHLNLRQRWEFYNFAYSNGMLWTALDSLTGQWSVKGPEHYMYFRLMKEPSASLEDILSDFYSAFGPAAGEVEKYFDYWENYNLRLRDEGRWNASWHRPTWIPPQYPPEAFEPAEEILEEAEKKALGAAGGEYARRVRFLQLGLRHARLSVEFVRKMHVHGVEEEPDIFNDAREALNRLIEFRREHEEKYIADFARNAMGEFRGYSGLIEKLLSGEAPAQSAADNENTRPEPAGDVQWPGEWVVFAPAGYDAPPPPEAKLVKIPESITAAGIPLHAEKIIPIRNQHDFGPVFGPEPLRQTAYVYIPLHSPRPAEVSLGFGADWWMQAWLNGEIILDTTDKGNGSWPPSIRDHVVNARLEAGENIIAVRFLSGTGSSILAAGGPSELRGPVFPSLIYAE